MKYYVVNAFTDKPFSGNPAGVCLLDSWPSEQFMQNIAGENNLPETAFVVAGKEGYHIRWFTPAFEMDLCGHATLASGFVVSKFCGGGEVVNFTSQSGALSVLCKGDICTLDFPSRPPVQVPKHELVERCLGVPVLGCYRSRDLIVELESEQAVAQLKPDFELMAQVPELVGMVPTARGSDCDFVSRYFDPSDKIIEDPVTGSAHCSLIPFWASKLGKSEMVARQLSERGGTLYCRDNGDRVSISGRALLYSVGEIAIQP